MAKWLFWLIGVSLTYLAGKMSSEFVKWLIVMGSAPTPEAKGIMIGYLASAAMPILLFGVPAILCWLWLFRSQDRGEAALFLALELAFVAYMVYGDVQTSTSILLPK